MMTSPIMPVIRSVSYRNILLCILCLLLTPLPAHAAPARQDDGSLYTVGACRNLDRENLRSEIEQAALGVFTGEGNSLDIGALVARKWRGAGVDAVIDAEVARAVAALAEQEGYLDRLWSGWSAEKAEEYAGRVAEDAFRSSAFTAKIEEVGNAVGAEIARAIDAQFTRAASAAFLCLKDYVGEAYADVLFEAFQSRVDAQVRQSEFAIDPATLSLSALETHRAGLVGVSVIVITEVGRRISQKIGEKIAQRIAGKIIGRVVGKAGSAFLPVIGWAVGIGLIAWDLYEGGKGSLPQIEESLTSEEIKERIRSEIVDAVTAGLPEETSIASLEIAVTLVEIWDAFCNERGELCRLAADNAEFRNLLDNTSLAELEHLNVLVNVFVNEIGRVHLSRAVETGALDVLLAEPAATALLTTTRSLSETLAWMDLADGKAAQVVALGVAQQAQPGEFDAASLANLLALNDAEAVARILALNAEETTALVTLPPETLRELLSNYTLLELAWLARNASRAELTQLVTGAQTLEQLQAAMTPTPMPTPTPSPTPSAAVALSGSDNTWAPLVVALVGLIIGLAVVSLLLWRRRKDVV